MLKNQFGVRNIFTILAAGSGPDLAWADACVIQNGDGFLQNGGVGAAKFAFAQLVKQGFARQGVDGVVEVQQQLGDVAPR